MKSKTIAVSFLVLLAASGQVELKGNRKQPQRSAADLQRSMQEFMKNRKPPTPEEIAQMEKEDYDMLRGPGTYIRKATTKSPLSTAKEAKGKPFPNVVV